MPHADIHYIKAMENFVQIVTRKETHTNLTPMKKILERLPPDKFVQVHRSYIVNVREVISIEKDSIKITLFEELADLEDTFNQTTDRFEGAQTGFPLKTTNSRRKSIAPCDARG